MTDRICICTRWPEDLKRWLHREGCEYIDWQAIADQAARDLQPIWIRNRTERQS